MRESLNEIAARVHEANYKWWLDLGNKCTTCDGTGKIAYNTMHSLKCTDCRGYGFRKGPRNVGEMLMLCVSELSEAMEGHRKHLFDDKLPEYRMFDVEIVDCFIRLFDLAYGIGIDLDTIFEAKMRYNTVRKDHQLEHRMSEHGKKY